MKKIRIISLVLAAVLCVCALAACESGNNDNGGKENGNKTDASTVSITIVDNEGKTIYENKALDINLATDATEEGKLFIENILAVVNYYDDSVTYDYNADDKLLTINNMAAINGTVTEQVAQIVEKEETEEEKEGEEDKKDDEPEIIYVDVDYCYFWTMTINDKEVSIDDEINLGDTVVLTFTKITAEELLNE